MAFALREEGRFSVIPTVSRFSVAAYEAKTRLILVHRWLDCQAYLATDDEKLEVIRIRRIGGEQSSVLMPLLKCMVDEWLTTPFTRVLSAQYF